MDPPPPRPQRARAPRGKKKDDSSPAAAPVPAPPAPAASMLPEPDAPAAQPAQVHASATAFAPISSEDESVIVRLQVNSDEVASPYDAIMQTASFSSVPMDVPPTAAATTATAAVPLNALFAREVSDPHLPAQQQAQPRNSTKVASVVKLLAEFGEKSKNGEWPSSTSVHCHWCCHPFDTVPFGMPVKYAAGQFHVIGCFCSVECTCSRIFASARDSIDECMNRYSLLNAMAKSCGLGSEPIRPAPNKEALKTFGGHLGIEQFRTYGRPCATSAEDGARSIATRRIVVYCPPMQSLAQHAEEVNDTDLSSEYRYIPIDSDRVTRYQEKIRLMRTKPLINFKNTLDHTMKLKYTEKTA